VSESPGLRTRARARARASGQRAGFGGAGEGGDFWGPGQLVVEPALIQGSKRAGVVEGGGVDFEEVWDGGIKEGERGAALGAEGAVAVGEVDLFGWSGFPDEGAGWEEGPDDEGCAAGAAAVGAVAGGGLKGRAGEMIARSTAEAAAGERGGFHEGVDFNRSRAVVEVVDPFVSVARERGRFLRSESQTVFGRQRGAQVQLVASVVILLIHHVTELVIDGEFGDMALAVEVPDLVLTSGSNRIARCGVVFRVTAKDD